MTAAHSSTRSGRGAPAYIDTSKASIARVYDAALGGKDNYATDREVVDRLRAVAPEVQQMALDHRSFLIRAARFLAGEAGLTQFLDCGSGLPTAENTHQVVQRVQPDAVVVYVDNDPSVVSHGRALLEENENTYFVPADIFEPRQVLENPTVTEHLDFDRPLALFQMGTFHHYDETGRRKAADVMQEYIDALAPGSYIALGHFFDPEDDDTPLARRLEQIMIESPMGTGLFRTRAEIEALLPGLDLVEPGVSVCADWWPDGPRIKALQPAQRTVCGVVARKP